ncbi:unnamed protein product [Phaedon cochleariae]|uniref:Mismatch repair endonuclease PMS2 n=1 Tax=Phaedon cochleariae TaxID=80249 RepID=A0A9P0GXJ2_PHACE|nr:unnamed protein product [Phaedon cochleariae]
MHKKCSKRLGNMIFQGRSSDSSCTRPIKAINRNTVHRICSGQVVLSLGIAIKELVENSLDAGATIIDILLKEYGSELVEVSDNGSGVLPDNFEALTLKHFTSKISNFSDLENIGTLGFRGEALSSLCALSNLEITTRHHSQNVATKITYDCNGKVKSQVSLARECGTTVTLEKLFSTLPVRRKEFMKHLKREFSKMCQLLHAYCLVSKGIKFNCTNIASSGSKSVVLATNGKNTVRENIINIFGAKQISALIDVHEIIPDDLILNEFGIKSPEESDLPFSFEFLISSVTHGSGRSTTDRQFYYINSRPCEPAKLMKLVNEVYRQFNSNQYPFVYLNIMTKSLQVDVNVTPDKRQIYIENEKILLGTVKASLLECFKSFPSTFKLQNLDVSQNFHSDKVSDRGIKRSLTDTSIVKKGSILETFKKRSKTEGSKSKSFDISSFVISPKRKSSDTKTADNNSENEVKKYKYQTKSPDSDVEKDAEHQLEMLVELACKLSKEDNEENIIDVETEQKTSYDDFEVKLDETEENKIYKNESVIFNISLEQIREVLNSGDDTNDHIQVKFRSEITPESNKVAEEELQKQFLKEDFKKMDIIGQFNLGFIIARLKHDLFIVDQHATDEKYNFEQLQQNTVIESQVLVNPKPLQLTAGNEILLIDNIEIFKKNGFSFSIDETAPYTKKVMLTAIPVSRNYAFGKDDIDEMLFMLQDSSQTMCRPSRVRSMFASRACRKSVMIGQTLTKSDMRRLVDHMGEIEQPWNCPHGRPTMRHLINLDLLKPQD